MDEGLTHETLPVSIASQGLTHLVLISLSGYLNTHIHSVSALREQEMQCACSEHIQIQPQVKDKQETYAKVKLCLLKMFSDAVTCHKHQPNANTEISLLSLSV